MPGLHTIVDMYANYATKEPAAAPTMQLISVGEGWCVTVDFYDFDTDDAEEGDNPYLEIDLSHSEAQRDWSVSWRVSDGRLVLASGDGWGSLRGAWPALTSQRDRVSRKAKGN